MANTATSTIQYKAAASLGSKPSRKSASYSIKAAKVAKAMKSASKKTHSFSYAKK
jgi:hypothetical protein